MPLQTWRILLPRLTESPMDLDEELFQALQELEQQRQQQSINWEAASSWSVDQDKGSLTLFFDDDTELKAKIQIIGTFDGNTFLWAWANPSVNDELKNDSHKLKKYGIQHGWSIFSAASFPATVRDGYAIMALAAKLFGSDGAYAGDSGGTVTYLTLSELPESAQPITEQIVFEPPSILGNLNSLLAAQIGSEQLDLNDLREIENICRRGYVQSMAGDHLAAAECYDEAWEKLGEFAADQEPASWIKLAKGNALYLAGEVEEALSTLIEAEQILGCPDPALLYQRMGQCYAALGNNDKAIDLFARVYVTRGAQGLAELASAERDLFAKELEARRQKARQAIAESKTRRRKDKQLTEAAATVSCLIEELHAFELYAHKQESKARKSRKVLSELDDEDTEARERINSQWTWLMAVWCTPLRSPFCESIQYPPAHDPNKEKLKRVWRTESELIAVETVTEDSFGCTNTWRYELEDVTGTLLISQIYSIWEDEEYSTI